MAAGRAPRVYSAEIDGVHEWIVAAPNQRAALDALGVRQDLFAQGLARPETDAAKIDAARARPGVPLRRPMGSKRDFEPADAAGGSAWDAALAAAPKPRKGTRGRRSAGAGRAAEVQAPPPDRRPVLEARKALKAFEQEAARTLSDLDEQSAELARRAKRTEADLADRRGRLERALEKAEAAYERARART